VYGLLHQPGYHARFAENLKHELPRIPLAPAGSHSPQPSPPEGRGSKKRATSGQGKREASRGKEFTPSPLEGEGRGEGFWAFADAGKELAELHLNYEQLQPFSLQFIESSGAPLSYRVEDKMRLSKDKSAITVNPSLVLDGIPSECFEYRLGNRSALEWVIDQYQITTDKRSGIRSDPNRPDDEQYIVRLVGQVVRVSVETTRIVDALPSQFNE
jgi:predicted helicase